MPFYSVSRNRYPRKNIDRRNGLTTNRSHRPYTVEVMLVARSPVGVHVWVSLVVRLPALPAHFRVQARSPPACRVAPQCLCPFRPVNMDVHHFVAVFQVWVSYMLIFTHLRIFFCHPSPTLRFWFRIFIVSVSSSSVVCSSISINGILCQIRSYLESSSLVLLVVFVSFISLKLVG